MDTDQEAAELLAPLKDHAGPSSGLDIGEAVVKGQRRLRARRWSGLGAAAAFIALVPVSLALIDGPDAKESPTALQPAQSTAPSPAKPPPAAFPASCTARTLPAPPGATFTFVDHGDPSGRYLVGGYEDRNGNRRPLLWDNGNLIVLNAPGQDNSSLVVNEHGLVAGSSITTIEGKTDYYNWTYRDGAFTLITEVGHGMVEYRSVVDINARNEILLDSRMRISPPAPHQGPAIWTGSQLRELSAPPGLKGVTAMSLDDDGTVVGRYMIEEGWAGERSLVWSPGDTATEFKVPNGFGPAGTLRLVREGWAVGSFTTPGKPGHEPTELVGSLRSGGFAPAGIKMAFGINRHGWMAGFEAGPDRTQIPAIAGDGKKLTLPIPSGATAADEISAASISDDGRTVGGTVMVAGSGDHVPVLWTCQP